jgi:hypothetical protein
MKKYAELRWIKQKANFLRAVNELGGKCTNCGEEHIATLDFHHFDGEKEFNMANLLRKMDWEQVKLELTKCQLLCSNCHRKSHFDSKRYNAHKDEIFARANGWKPLREISLKRFTDNDKDLLIKLYNEGNLVEQISRAMARTTSVVRRKIQELIENGVLTERNIQSQRKCRKVVDPEQVLCLWNQGFPVAKISNTLDISVNQIYKVIKEVRNG